MASQRIDFNHIKTYAITENNKIGVTDSLTLRTLDTTPTDLNSVYLAMNGSDAGANGSASTGISSAPVLTLEKAIDVIQAQPARNTIHISRNAYVGTLTFSLTANHSGGDALPSSSVIQSELGEAPIINFTGVGYISNIGKLNGLDIIIGSNTGSGHIIVFQSMKWCKYSFTQNYTMSDRQSITNRGTLANNIFDGINALFSDTTNASNNNLSYMILVENVDQTIQDNAIVNCAPSGAGIAINNDEPFSAQTYEHNTIANCSYGIYIPRGTPADTSRGIALTIKNNLFGRNGVDIYDYYLDQSQDPGITPGEFYTVDYNMTSNSKLFGNNLFDIGTHTVTLGDNQVFGFSSLFFNNTTDFRLMDQRRIPPDSTKNFFFTSKAVYNVDINQTLSDDGRDLGAYDFSYVLDLDTWDSILFGNEDWNGDFDIIYDLINYQTFQDIRGNFRRAFDGDWGKRTINLAMEGMTYYGTRESYDLLDLMQFRGAKRLYPFGNDAIFASSGSLVINAVSEFDTVLDNISNLRRNAYRGFICDISSGASAYQLQISQNSSGSLVLRDHRGNQSGIPDGNYLIQCLYMPVEIDMGSITQNWKNWDPQANPLYPDHDVITIPNYENVDNTDPQSWEGHVRELILKETEEDE